MIITDFTPLSKAKSTQNLTFFSKIFKIFEIDVRKERNY